MADGSIVFSNGYVWVNNVDLGAFTKEVGFNLSAETVDDSAMGDTYRSRLSGARSWGLSLTFNQDFVSAGPHATLFPLFGTSACFELRPVNACASANNQSITGIAIMTEYPVLNGAWMDLVESPVTFEGKDSPTFASSS